MSAYFRFPTMTSLGPKIHVFERHIEEFVTARRVGIETGRGRPCGVGSVAAENVTEAVEQDGLWSGCDGRHAGHGSSLCEAYGMWALTVSEDKSNTANLMQLVRLIRPQSCSSIDEGSASQWEAIILA